ncbi:MAG: Ig-like domain-containing protein, partial [Bifidobacteriaceae bacterium]|nr:Ig-like domain-containing protein [Bifidobacteriaceae bacterium]
TWKSSKASVASVSASGKITAKKRGKATISATAGGKTVKIAVTVRAKGSAKAKVTKVSATGVPKTMKVGQVAWVTASYAPATATGVKATFASSSAARAAIDKTGRLTAKAPGKATITVKAGTKTKKYTVTVTAS